MCLLSLSLGSVDCQMSRYFLARGRVSSSYRQSGDANYHTDSLVAALLERNLLRAADGPMNEYGPWQVVDTSVSPWRFVGEPEPDLSGLKEFSRA